MLKDAALHSCHDLLGFPIIRENYRQEWDDWKIDLKINESMVVYLTKRQFKKENTGVRTNERGYCGPGKAGSRRTK